MNEKLIPPATCSPTPPQLGFDGQTIKYSFQLDQSFILTDGMIGTDTIWITSLIYLLTQVGLENHDDNKNHNVIITMPMTIIMYVQTQMD